MKTKIFKNANYLGGIVIIMIFVFIYFSYFFVYIPNKESQLRQKGFRILKEYGSNMVDKHEYFENHFNNYGLFYDIQFLVESNVISKKDTNRIEKVFRKKSEEIANFINGLPEYVNTSMDSIDSSYFYEENGKALFLVFKCKETDADFLGPINQYYECKSKGCLDKLNINDFSYSIPINYFMANLKFDELFENIILFDEMNVSYNSNNSNLVDITNPKALCDSAKNTQGGIYKTINIRGEDKHLMILPIDFAGKKFYVSGFISNTDFQNKTRTINKQLLIFIAGILLLVFAGMPILKIFFIDDRERLKARDASSSGVSLLFGIGLFILLIISFSKKQFVDQTLHNRRIDMISEKLISNVTHDIDSLKTLGGSIASGKKSHYSTFSDSVYTIFHSQNLFVQDSALSRPFPLNEIFLINKDGIFTKGYTRTPFSDIVKVDLKERQYFKNIVDINNSWPTSDSLNIYIESIKSLNTTAVETAVSFYTTNFDTLPVLAITSKIPSLYNQVLPKDIEFVIINKKGKVLYHSMEEKNLHENFVQECESDVNLINAINLQIEDNIQINYNEKKWLARIVPIKETPLYHITLLDLNQADTKNARIFLFTFYFLIATLIFIIIGLIILRWVMHVQNKIQKHTWFLNWLVLQPQNYLLYKILSVDLAVIIVVQLFVFLFNLNPIAILLYQLIFVVYTLFISMIFLNRKENLSKNSFMIEFFTELNIFIVIVMLILIYLLKFNSGLQFLIPLFVLIVITVFNYRFIRDIKSRKIQLNTPKNLTESKLKVNYLSFLFLFLISISAVPVVVYYFSIKNQEEIIWEKEQLFKVALDNVELLSVYNERNHDWFKHVQGNGIDSMNITYALFDKNIDLTILKDTGNIDYARKIYSSLPDPITNWYNQPKLLTPNSYVQTKFENNTLKFKKGLLNGIVAVNYPKNLKSLYPTGSYVLLVLFIFIITTTCVILLLKYLASVLLNLNQEKPAASEKSWIEILKNNDIKRILLNSFDGNCFLEKSKEIVKLKDSGIKEIVPLPVSQIMMPDFKIETLSNDPKKIIWISGINQIIYYFDKHEALLTNINKLNENSLYRIIVDLSFDIGLVDEFYDDYIASAELKPEQLTNIFLLRKKWGDLFKDFDNFNGFLNQSKVVNSETKRAEDSFKPECTNENLNSRYLHIWNNLTSFEKIVLFDLADDGLLNRKNKEIIQKLINKRLIITDSVPDFFSGEFRDFVRKSIKSTEVRAIERKLGLKGTWHNAKYLILLILIPLAAFIVISQGISIEKVFGIFAGGLAIITGVLRLLDSGTFRQS